MKYKILLTDCIFNDQKIEKEILKKIDAELVIAPDKEEDTLLKMAKEADGILVTYANITKRIIENTDKCKIIVRTGIGYNNIDIPAANKKGIMVANIPDYCIAEVADHTLALMLSCLRKINLYVASVKKGIWDMNSGRPIKRIGDLTLGVYGFGNIARAVASRAQAFGMKITAYDPYLDNEKFKENNAERISDFKKFVSNADVLSLHAPLTKDNEGIFDSEIFALMKKSAYLINTSRGGLVNEKDLCTAIEKKQIAGCGLDVMQTEPGDLESPLHKYDSVYITPHAAFYSDGSDIELRVKSTEQIVQALIEGKPKYLVNRKI